MKRANVVSAILLILFFPIGIILMWMKSTWSKKTKWIITAVFAFFVFLSIVGSGSSTNSTKASSTTTSPSVPTTSLSRQIKKPVPTVVAKPTSQPKPKDTPTPTLTPQELIQQFQSEAENVTVADIYKNPNSYNGKYLIFTCVVSGFPKDSNGDVGAINCSDTNDFGSNAQVGINSSIDVNKINSNDSVRVYGMGTGAIQGKNAYGGDITTGGATALYVEDLTTGYKSSIDQLK